MSHQSEPFDGGKPDLAGRAATRTPLTQTVSGLPVEALAPGAEEPGMARRILDNLFTFVGVLSLDGTLLEANEAPLRLNNITIEQIRGLKFWDCPWWNYDQQVQTQLRQACERAAEGHVVRYDVRIRAGQDQHIIIDFQVAPLRDERGVITHLIPSATDVTQRVQVEDRLRAGEERYRNLLTMLPAAVYTCDLSGCITYCNHQATQIWGRTPALGDTDEKFCGSFKLHRPDGTPMPHAQTPMAVTLRTGQSFTNQEVVIERPDGSRVTVAVNIQPLRDEQGVQNGAINVFSDITLPKAAAEALRESEEHFRVMADGLPHIIWVHDETGRLAFINETYCEYFGQSREALLSDQWQVLTHPDDGTAYGDEFLACVKEQRPFHAQTRVQCKGQWRWIESWGRPRFDAQGQYLGHVGSSVDITDRKAAEDAIRQSEEKLRGVFENAAAGMVLADLQGRFLQVNGRMCQMLGYEREELLGKDYTQITHPDDVAADTSQFEQLKRGEIDNYSMRKRYLRKDGSPLWVHLSTGLLRDVQGQVQLVIGAVQDISAQVQAEHALSQINATLEARVQSRTHVIRQQSDQVRRMALEVIEAEERERKRIAAVLHDELQQLLAAVRMRVTILRRQVLPQHQKDWQGVDELVVASLQAARTLAVDLSPPLLRDAGLAPAMQWLVGRFAEQHRLTVHLEADPHAEPDDSELRSFVFQTARECLFNVVKHAKVSEAFVQLELKDGMVHLTIADHGQGCDSVAKGGGTGLGLFGIAQRVARLGGWSEMQSAPQQGCTVTLAVPKNARTPARGTPLRSRGPEKDAGDTAADTDPTSATQTLTLPEKIIRVVVVDDHKLVREGLARLLDEQPDVEMVGEAGDGVEALEVVRLMRPDVVMMDITMPRMDGVEATRQITSQWPSVKVVALSMHESDEMAQRMRAAGAVAYVLKGGMTEEILDAIRAVHREAGA